MVQKEVAERIRAQPPQMNLLALMVQFYGQSQIIDFVPASCFWPKPKVDSAIIKIVVKKQIPRVGGELDEKLFFRLVKIGFSAKRKKLYNNLASGFQITKEKAKELLEKAGLFSSPRPQELSLADWLSLYQIVKQTF